MLAMLTRTYNSIKKTQEVDGLVLNSIPVWSRFEECGDYRLFSEEKTRQNIGDWLDKSHRSLSVRPSHVISHTIDKAANDVLRAKIWNFQTREERLRKDHRHHMSHPQSGHERKQGTRYKLPQAQLEPRGKGASHQASHFYCEHQPQWSPQAAGR